MVLPKAFHTDQRGSAAVEFSLVIPGMVLLIFAILHMGAMVYSEVRLHWAVEQASRCAVVTEQYTSSPTGDSAVSCSSIALTQSYASGLFSAPLSSPSFTASLNSTNSCKQVSGSGSYSIRIWGINLNVPLTAQACYPTTVTSWS
jgi:Flp pilus assembly protein TadG